MTLPSPHQGPLAKLRSALGYVDFHQLPTGISFAGAEHPTADIRLLVDLTWVDESGTRQLDQEIFDELLAVVRGAKRLILLDMFLFNDLLKMDGETPRPLTAELTAALIAQKREQPGLQIYFITDPCNTVYGSLISPWFERLKSAGIRVIMSDLDKLRDSNPVYTFLWRLFARPLSNSPGRLLANPFGGSGRISLRSVLQIANMKANHRKTLIADQDDAWVGIISTANPHDASFAHRNVAIRFTGPAVKDLYQTEKAVLQMCNVEPPEIDIDPVEQQAETSLQILTERKIKDGVLDVIDRARPGDSLDMVLFYIADRDVLNALKMASDRQVRIRMVLDPNKDAFGWSKSGIPNRPVAHQLVKAGMEIRWADTRGEQCHSKMLSASYRNADHALILGSANFTRRNLDDFNLETDVKVTGPPTAPVIDRANRIFDLIWYNRDGRVFTVDYGVYEEKSRLQHWIYWFMERTGISTF